MYTRMHMHTHMLTRTHTHAHSASPRPSLPPCVSLPGSSLSPAQFLAWSLKNKNFITSELELPQWPRCVQGPRAPGPLWTHPRAPRCSQPASPRPGRLGWSHSRLLPVPARPGGLPPVLAGLRPGDKFSPRVPWRGTLPVLWFPHRGFSITSSPVSVLMISSQRSLGGWGGCGEQ